MNIIALVLMVVGGVLMLGSFIFVGVCMRSHENPLSDPPKGNPYYGIVGMMFGLLLVHGLITQVNRIKWFLATVMVIFILNLVREITLRTGMATG